MSKILSIITYPNPLLKKQSLKVEKVDAEIQKLLDNMVATMYHDRGCGLAAVQVGILKRILVIDLNYQLKENCHDHSCNESHITNAKPYFIINPEIVDKSKDVELLEQGCLSFPGIYVEVTRPKKVSVKYLDYHGKEQLIEAEGILSHCLQHEIDHLNGVTFIDHVSRLKREMMLKKLQKIGKNE